MRAGRLIASTVLAVLGGGAAIAQTEPLLQLQGQPYSNGAMTLHLSAEVGLPAYVLYGLDPLDPPLQLSKGPFYIGTLANAVLLGAVPSGGRMDVAFTVPPLAPVLAGIPLVLQGFVPGALSNPATLPLDQPYLLSGNAVVVDNPSPTTQAAYGDRVAVGDFDGDGAADLAVGAWFEDVGPLDKAGRVYVHWGPEFTSFEALASLAPKQLGEFGGGLVVGDIDGDGVDDLVVGEACGGSPPTPGAHGFLHVYRGIGRVVAHGTSLPSDVTGSDAVLYGRFSVAGDVNDDGWIDLVVGQQHADAGVSHAGRLEVFHGPSYGRPTIVENPDPQTDDYFGSQVCLADVTGDGVPDIVESSGRANVGAVVDAGRVHVFDGTTLALLKTIDNPSPATGARFGEGLTAADLDGDGTAEVVASDVKHHVYVVWDPLVATDVTVRSKPPSPNPGGSDTSFGYFLAVRDLSGDGLADIAVADPFEGDLSGCAGGAGGSVYVLLAPYFSTSLRLPSPDPACGDLFSWAMIAADADGDGSDELVVGAQSTDVGGFDNAGRVVILRP